MEERSLPSEESGHASISEDARADLETDTRHSGTRSHWYLLAAGVLSALVAWLCHALGRQVAFRILSAASFLLLVIGLALALRSQGPDTSDPALLADLFDGD